MAFVISFVTFPVFLSLSLWLATRPSAPADPPTRTLTCSTHPPARELPPFDLPYFHPKWAEAHLGHSEYTDFPSLTFWPCYTP